LATCGKGTAKEHNKVLQEGKSATEVAGWLQWLIRNCLTVTANTHRHSADLVHQQHHQALQNLPINNRNKTASWHNRESAIY